MSKIHPTAIIEDGAKLGKDIEVGAYAYIGSEAEIGDGSVVFHHATVEGFTKMGKNNQVFPYAYIGGKTHDLKYVGGKPGLKIGDGNVFREYATVHLATAPDTFTIIGNNNHILAYSHVAHDCIVGNNIVMSSHAALGGHVVVEDRVVIGWNCGVHQFCRIGAYAMAAATAKIVKDLPPFMVGEGSPASVCAINKLNMQRNEFSEAEINTAFSCLKLLYMKGLNRKTAIEELAKRPDADGRVVQMILKFCNDSTERGL